MISDERVAEVRRLEAEGVTQREIAKRTKISRRTVTMILSATGKHDDGHTEPPPVRCPNCRYVVVLPCVVCGYRKKRKPRVNPYRDNLFLHLVCIPATLTPHTPDKEDEWDDEYERRRPWLRS
jgi:hypothetical protein